MKLTMISHFINLNTGPRLDTGPQYVINEFESAFYTSGGRAEFIVFFFSLSFSNIKTKNELI